MDMENAPRCLSRSRGCDVAIAVWKRRARRRTTHPPIMSYELSTHGVYWAQQEIYTAVRALRWTHCAAREARWTLHGARLEAGLYYPLLEAAAAATVGGSK